MKYGTIGHMRQQSALENADTQIVLVSKNPKVLKMLQGLRVMNSYADTTDAFGNWTGTFKIEVVADDE